MAMNTAHPGSASPTARQTFLLTPDQSEQLGEEHTRIAGRLLNDESIRIESTRDFFEQHSIFDHEASFEEIFGLYDEYEAINKSSEVQATSEEEIARFIPIVHNDATPMQRFVVIDPVNEPCYLYGKQQLSMVDLKLGNETSATIRVLASLAVAAQNKRDRR